MAAQPTCENNPGASAWRPARDFGLIGSFTAGYAIARMYCHLRTAPPSAASSGKISISTAAGTNAYAKRQKRLRQSWKPYTLMPRITSPFSTRSCSRPSNARTAEQILRKLRIVAAYIDILIARRIWNSKSTSYSTMQYAIQLIILNIRGKPANELADILIGRLHAEGLLFGDNDRFRRPERSPDSPARPHGTLVPAKPPVRGNRGRAYLGRPS